ncbi:unnamed protein product [Dracunculus medinensis]|uniref:Uncharacterized protein n=1 Tax=Dracunculus medinensis TaxID=318479 RepID=A0A0N4UK89_DRAME|nr:unnamed protein product [Dracunculus medinensis]
MKIGERSSSGHYLGIKWCPLEQRSCKRHRRLLIQTYLPWCIEQAVNGRFLLAFDWENHFEKDLSDLQKLCSIISLAEYCSL